MGYSDLKELLKDAKNFATGANDLQLKSVLLDIQEAVYDLQEENRDLRDEINTLKNNQFLSSELEYHEGVYTKDYSVYCATCWDDKNKLVRVRTVNKGPDRDTMYYCDTCKQFRYSNIPYKL